MLPSTDMFNPRDATQSSFLTSVARKLGFRRESHVIYLFLFLLILIIYMGYSALTIFAPKPLHIKIQPINSQFLGVDTVHQSVPNPRGLVMLFHGCSHEANDWFTLPEEKRIVSGLLHAQFSVIAFSSHDRTSGCWNERYPDIIDNPDIQAVSKTLRTYLTQEQRTLENTPLFAVGASSGGSFLSVVSRIFPLYGGVIIVSTGNHGALTTQVTNQALPIPPLTYIYMMRDTWANTEKINIVINEMMNTHSNIIRPLVYQADPHPLTSTYMSERISSITQQQSQRIYELSKQKWIDDKGMLLTDPRESQMLPDIIGLMEKEGVSSLNTRVVHDSLVEELNVLWGKHEMTSEYIETWIPWMSKLADQVIKKL